jgi:hypothetical protein
MTALSDTKLAGGQGQSLNSHEPLTLDVYHEHI